MKKIVYSGALILLFACQPKVAETASTATPEPKVEEPQKKEEQKRNTLMDPNRVPTQAQPGEIVTDLEPLQGARLYTMKCASCHALKPVRDFSQEQWNKILPDMAKKAKIDAAQETLIMAYIKNELGQ
jgi:hypothetical protein